MQHNINQLGDELEAALLAIDRVAARRIFAEMPSTGALPDLLDSLVVPVLARIGSNWERGQIALSQVYMSGRIVEELMTTVQPFSRSETKIHPKLAIVALEDHHQLGKRMVASFLRASGYSVIDYGHGVGVDELADRLQQDQVRILLISTLMLPSALRVKNLRMALDARGVELKIVVGGAPFNFDERLWVEVGANAMGRSAADAVALVERMVATL